MATKSKTPINFTAGRRSKYPWEQWLDGDPWILTPGEDFTTTAEAFQSAVWRASNARGVKTRTMIDGDKLYLQAFAAEAEDAD